MTRTTNARLAGFTFLFYIAAGISSMVVYGKAAAGVGVAAKLASIGQHATAVGISGLLNLLCGFSAIVLGVSLHGLTRDEDRDLAMLAMVCRVAEGVIGALSVETTAGLLWLAAGRAPDVQSAIAIGTHLSIPGAPIAAIFFAVGSTIFCYLFLRGRLIPVPLAWLGVFSSLILVVALPLQIVGVVPGLVTSFMVIWMPMLAFELAVAAWLIVKGVAPVPESPTVPGRDR